MSNTDLLNCVSFNKGYAHIKNGFLKVIFFSQKKKVVLGSLAGTVGEHVT